MSRTRADYPLAETQADAVVGPRGKRLSDITLDAVLDGSITMEDQRLGRDAGRSTLAQNFERASELVNVPQDVIMQIYELLRPGRARTKQQLQDAAAMLRTQYGAMSIAAFVEEAAATYEQRGLFTFRF